MLLENWCEKPLRFIEDKTSIYLDGQKTGQESVDQWAPIAHEKCWVGRLDALHTVFNSSHALRKIINGSALMVKSVPLFTENLVLLNWCSGILPRDNSVSSAYVHSFMTVDRVSSSLCSRLPNSSYRNQKIALKWFQTAPPNKDKGANERRWLFLAFFITPELNFFNAASVLTKF